MAAACGGPNIALHAAATKDAAAAPTGTSAPADPTTVPPTSSTTTTPVASTATSPTTSSVPRTPTTWPRTTISVAQRYTDTLTRHNGAIRVEPAAPDDVPATSRAGAWKGFLATGLFPQTAKTYTADIRYGLFSDDQYGATPTPMYQRFRAWIIRWDSVPDEVSAKGGANSYNPTDGTAATTTSSTTRSNVNILVVMDARTGKYVMAIDDGTTAS